jgi:small subunit ribosomal protein S16
VAVKIKLKRLGKIRAPYYRIVVADARTKRDGRAIEEIGKYHPKAEPSFIEVNSDRAQHWLSVGAQPTDPVRKILEITGDWQKFKGLPGAEGTLKTAPPKEDRKEIFAAAVKETLGDGRATTTKSRGKSGAGKDADSGADRSGKAEKSGKADQADKAAKADKDAGSGRGGRQTRAKSGEQSGKAAAKSGGAAAAKDKSEGAAETPAAEAPAADAEAPAAEAPAADAASADAPAGDAAEAKAEPAAADAESASGD